MTFDIDNMKAWALKAMDDLKDDYDRYMVFILADVMKAQAAERQAAALERIAALLESLVSDSGNLKVEKP